MARINFVIPKPGLPRKPLLRQTLTQKNQGSNEEIVLCSVNIFIVVTAMVGMTKSPCHLHRCRGTRAYNRGFAILGFIQSLTENARKAGRLADDDAESEKNTRQHQKTGCEDKQAIRSPFGDHCIQYPDRKIEEFAKEHDSLNN